MIKAINLEVVAGRNEHPERLIRRFINSCKKDGLDKEIREKSPIAKSRFKSKRERKIEKRKNHQLELQRQERKKKKAAERRRHNYKR
jgi:hypothetical protein